MIYVEEICGQVTERYPYTHRVDVCAALLTNVARDLHHQQFVNWLNETQTPYCMVGVPGVFYMRAEGVALLLLKFS